jgi:hypothetical protein
VAFLSLPGPHTTHIHTVAGGALAAPVLTAGIGLHRTRSGSAGPGLGPPRPSGPHAAAPFTDGMDPADAAALGAAVAPPQPPPAAPVPVLAGRVPTFHGPSRPCGDLPPREPPPRPSGGGGGGGGGGPLGAFARRLSRARSGEEGDVEAGKGTA